MQEGECGGGGGGGEQQGFSESSQDLRDRKLQRLNRSVLASSGILQVLYLLIRQSNKDSIDVQDVKPC